MQYAVCGCCFFFFFKQKTAYEMRISDWSSDVCSSDLRHCEGLGERASPLRQLRLRPPVLRPKQRAPRPTLEQVVVRDAQAAGENVVEHLIGAGLAGRPQLNRPVADHPRGGP